MTTNFYPIDMSLADALTVMQKTSIQICVKSVARSLIRYWILSAQYGGRPPVKRESKHYFFRLSSLEKELKEWLLSNQNLQPDVKNYVINWINEGLQDWDITRDLSWGVPIPLPEAKGKVFYGWFDNHLCYISSLVKFENDSGGNGKRFWNESEIYHFIGKDIIYHHYLFLLATRLGINSEYKASRLYPDKGPPYAAKPKDIKE